MRLSAAVRRYDLGYASQNVLISRKSILLAALFVFSVFINYFTPVAVRQVVFISYLLLFLRSDDDPFWIAFFYMLLWAPAYLFNNADPKYNLNFISIPGFPREFFYFEFVILVSFLKALRKNKNVRYRIHPVLLIIIIYSLFLLFITSVYSISFFKILRTVRFLIPFLLFYSIPILLHSKEKFLEVFNYFFLFSFLVFALQLLVFVTGSHLFTLLGGSIQTNTALTKEGFNIENELVRPTYSTHILFINIVIGIYYLFIREKERKKIPPLVPLFIFLSWFSLLLSGTRGYVLSSSVILFVYLSINFSRNIKHIISALIVLSITILIPSVRNQFNMALGRVSTVFLLLSGDVSAGGTLRRITEYMPAMESKILESPIFGFGYSNTFFSYTNGHIGNYNLVLNGGFIGLTLFLILMLYFIIKPYKLYLQTRRHSYIALSLGILGFFIIHSTSFSVFSFLVGANNYSMFFLFICFIVVVINEYKNYQRTQVAKQPQLSDTK